MSCAILLSLLAMAVQDVGEGAEPFQGTVESTGHRSYPWTLPRTEVAPEAPPAIDWSQVQEAPELVMEHPHGKTEPESRQAIQIDAATGRETVADLPTRQLLQRLWTIGQTLGHAPDESRFFSNDPSWNGDLTSINSTSFPWAAACRILYTDPDTGFQYMGSGTLIDAKYVITSGSVVNKGNNQGWYTGFRIYPAWDGDTDAYGEAGWTSASTFTGWSVSGNLGDCMGFLRLDRPVGFLTGWMGYGYDNNDSFYTTNLFNAAGYPSTCYSGAPDQLYYGFGSYDSVTTTMLNADAYWSCSTGGFQGTGTYWIDGNTNRFVHGCHTSRCYSCTPNTIGHTRMTQGKHDYFNDTYMPGGYPTTSPDYVALDVNTGPSDDDVTAGDSLSVLDYLVANSSLYNPIGTQTYNVDVYLSTNDFISTGDTLIDSHQFFWNFGSRTSVRVTPQPPTIPAGTPTGNYWIGVIVTGPSDLSSSNNDSSGWDAVPISVTSCQVQFSSIGQGLAGSGQFVPVLFGSGSACQAGQHSITITNALGGASGYLWLGFDQTVIPGFFGGTFYVDLSPPRFLFPITLGGAVGAPGAGYLNMPGNDKAGYQGLTFFLQGTFFDPGAVKGVSLTNALEFAIDS